ncbi:MAG: hypothetical protein NTW66_01535 [Candidatus Magasanikbacteria bacterium]|nr:hypothetical protein [Candidatus Magasanikbacteria bacterium]
MATNNIDELNNENDGLAEDKNEEMVGFHETVGEESEDEDEEESGDEIDDLDEDKDGVEVKKTKVEEDDDDDDNAKNDW